MYSSDCYCKCFIGTRRSTLCLNFAHEMLNRYFTSDILVSKVPVRWHEMAGLRFFICTIHWCQIQSVTIEWPEPDATETSTTPQLPSNDPAQEGGAPRPVGQRPAQDHGRGGQHVRQQAPEEKREVVRRHYFKYIDFLNELSLVFVLPLFYLEKYIAPSPKTVLSYILLRFHMLYCKYVKA